MSAFEPVIVELRHESDARFPLLTARPISKNEG